MQCWAPLLLSSPVECELLGADDTTLCERHYPDHSFGDDLERCHYSGELSAFFPLITSSRLALLLLLSEALHDGEGFVANVVLHAFSVNTRSRISHSKST